MKRGQPLYNEVHKCVLTVVSISGNAVSRVRLEAGDDAGEVAWTEASDRLNLYASHIEFIKEVVRRRGAAWDS